MYSENIFFCLIAPLTHRSNSKAIHKFSKFITGISFYYIQQVINPHRQRGYIINTKVFTTQQITSNEMNFNSTIPRHWKGLLWTTSDSLGWAIHCRSGDQRRTDHPGWSGLLYQYQGREPPKCPRYRHICVTTGFPGNKFPEKTVVLISPRITVSWWGSNLIQKFQAENKICSTRPFWLVSTTNGF